jgi:hypothetical protein
VLGSDEVSAPIDHHTGLGARGPNSAANALVRLDHVNRVAGVLNRAGRTESRQPSTDDCYVDRSCGSFRCTGICWQIVGRVVGTASKERAGSRTCTSNETTTRNVWFLHRSSVQWAEPRIECGPKELG